MVDLATFGVEPCSDESRCCKEGVGVGKEHAQLRATAGCMRDKAEGRLSKEQATDLRERINARQTTQSR